MSMFFEIDSLCSIDEDVYTPNTIERVDSAVTYSEFFTKYLACNRPCIIGSQATENWPCKREWVIEDAPNFEVLRKSFGRWIFPLEILRDAIINVT